MSDLTRHEQFLNHIADYDAPIPEPQTREEYLLREIADTVNEGGGTDLPEVTSDDNGDVLTVVDGAWGKEKKALILHSVDYEVDDVIYEVLDATPAEILAALDANVPVVYSGEGNVPHALLAFRPLYRVDEGDPTIRGYKAMFAGNIEYSEPPILPITFMSSDDWLGINLLMGRSYDVLAWGFNGSFSDAYFVSVDCFGTYLAYVTVASYNTSMDGMGGATGAYYQGSLSRVHDPETGDYYYQFEWGDNDPLLGDPREIIEGLLMQKLVTTTVGSWESKTGSGTREHRGGNISLFDIMANANDETFICFAL